MEGAAAKCTSGDMNTCCNSLVEKIGQILRGGEGVIDDEIVINPILRFWQSPSGGLIISCLYLIRLTINCWKEVLVGFNGGCETWTTGPWSRLLGIPFCALGAFERFILNRHFSKKYEEVDESLRAKPVVSFQHRFRDGALFLRESAGLWWSLAATSVCNRLPAIPFDEDKLTRLGEWFSQTIGAAPSDVFSRLSNIYSGRCESQ